MKVIYTEMCQTKKEAKAREVQIKSYKGGKAFQELIVPGSPRMRREIRISPMMPSRFPNYKADFLKYLTKLIPSCIV